MNLQEHPVIFLCYQYELNKTRQNHLIQFFAKITPLQNLKVANYKRFRVLER